MRTINNLNTKLEPIDVGSDAATEAARENQATYGRLYRLILSVAKGSPEEALDAYDLGVKIKTGGDSVEVTEGEHKLLTEKVKQNPTELYPYFLAQLLKNLR